MIKKKNKAVKLNKSAAFGQVQKLIKTKEKSEKKRTETQKKNADSASFAFIFMRINKLIHSKFRDNIVINQQEKIMFFYSGFICKIAKKHTSEVEKIAKMLTKKLNY